MQDSSKQIEEIFEAALQVSGEERTQLLDARCGADATLRGEVEELLAAFDDAPTSLLAQSAVRREAHDPALDPLIGTRIGPYHVLEALGEGGMGSVYLAQQGEPIERSVALKIIKLGMDTKRVVQRFDIERQALARMEHASIARVFDAGATEAGRPYFVMELVRGPVVTEYCQREQLSTRQRVRLFIQVCEAIQHAHQKGIIHRDLKPSNVLVTTQEGTATPKVIDFGIAKATSDDDHEGSLLTGPQQLIGTPAYMSPEQATGLDLDTRSDIYSLGVLLYELLTGTTPFESTRLLSAGYDEMVRIIRDEDPEKPSTRISTQSTSATPPPAHMPRLQARHFRDLDWIVMKCLEKEPPRRYETAAGLIADLERYLANEPVLASPPSTSYRLRKFVQRNKGAVIAASLVVLALVLGLIGTATFYFREADQRRLALQSGDQTRKVADFQAAMLSGIDTGEFGKLFFVELVAQTEQGLRREWIQDADGQMRKRTEEEVSQRLDQLREAIQLANSNDVARHVLSGGILEPAAQAIEEEFSTNQEVRYRLLRNLGIAYQSLDLLDLAIRYKTEALALAREVYGNSHTEVASLLHSLGISKRHREAYEEAQQLQREAWQIQSELLGSDAPETVNSLSNLGLTVLESGDLDSAETILEEALELSRAIDETPLISFNLNNLASVHKARGNPEAAAPYFQESLDIDERTLGRETIDFAVSLGNWAQTQRSLGNLDVAEESLLEALAILRRVVHSEHPSLATILNNLGALRFAQGNYESALPLIREALEIDRVRAPKSQFVALGLSNLGMLLARQGMYDEAEQHLTESHTLYRQLLGDRHIAIGRNLNGLGVLAFLQGQFEKATSYHERALEQLREFLGDENPHVAIVLANLGKSRVFMGQTEEGLAQLRVALETCERIAPQNPATLRVRKTFVEAWIELESFQVAEGELVNTLETYVQQSPTGYPAQQTREALAELYESWHQAEPGQGYDARAEALRSELEAKTAKAEGQ